MAQESGRLKVYVPVREGQDYKAAEEYGEIIAITEGEVDRYNTRQLFASISEKMKDAGQNDMILLSGLTLANCIATAIMARKHGAVTFLLFRRGEYLARRIICDPLDINLENEEAQRENRPMPHNT